MMDEHTTGPAPAPGRLLLVDDEPNILAALRRLLRRDGYDIVADTDAHAALRRLETEDFDVIVSDQRMPDITGVEFLRRAKTLRPHSMRIVLSGYTDLDSVTSAINEGAIYKFLTKPWDDDQLRSHIAAAMRHKHLESDNRRMAAELQLVNARQQALNAQLAALVHEQSNTLHRDEAVLDTLHLIMHRLPLPIVGCDDDGTVVFSNQAAERLFANGDQPVPLLGMALAVAWPAAPTRPPPWSLSAVRLGARQLRVECRALDPAQPQRGQLYLFFDEGPAP
jgi:CheY-like chemotaxis protein